LTMEAVLHDSVAAPSSPRATQLLLFQFVSSQLVQKRPGIPILRDDAQAEEVVQATYVHAYEHWPARL
jgi:hypothetical protein